MKSKRMRRGTTMVEAAIVMPLLLGLTMGALEYGWLFLHAQKLANIARQGARVAILSHGGAIDEAYGVIDALLEQAGLDDDLAGPPSIVPGPISGDPDGRQEITVTVSVSTANLAVVNAPLLIPIPGSLTAIVTMAKEGG